MKIAVVGAGYVGCALAEAELPVSLRDANPVNAEQPDNGPAELLGRRDGGGGDPGLGRMSLMFDHFGFNAADFASLLAWRAEASRLGLLAEGEGRAMIGEPRGRLWIGAFGPAASPIHIAFSAESRDQARAFYDAAIAAGGRDNGGPRIRANDAPTYYSALVYDPDGHNVEAVCLKPE
jgi:catechol 2,3-dioxygenase-like lactoylglutathione lyase family enzyme